jgi:hypothetical protein
MRAMTDLSRAESRPMGPRQFAMRAKPMTSAVVLLASALALSALVVPASADAISDWAAKADAVAAEQRESPRTRARTLAMVNIAMFEAINAVERGDTPHKLNISAERNTSIEAAAATAAHDVLVALYPDRAPDLSPALAVSLAGIADNVPKARGHALGKNAAAATLAMWLSTAQARKVDEILGRRP